MDLSFYTLYITIVYKLSTLKYRRETLNGPQFSYIIYTVSIVTVHKSKRGLCYLFGLQKLVKLPNAVTQKACQL